MKTLAKILLSPWLALITLALALTIRIENPAFVESIRLRYFDTIITSKPIVNSESIAVVNIDDATLEKFGQWPFPRDKYSAIIQELYQRGAGLVVFNVFMPDADRFGKDDVLAAKLKEFPVVLPQSATNDPLKTDVQAFRPGVSIIGYTGEQFTVNYDNIQPNVKEINDSVAGAGIVNTFPELDGVVRRVPMLVSSKGMLYPSISLETLRVAAGDPSFQVKITEFGVEAVRIPKFGKIATDTWSRIWVDWAHRPSHYSVANLPIDFAGKIVIVGLTARGLNNPIATSIGEQYPHELQAAVLDTLTNGSNITRVDWADGAELLATLIVAIISLLLARWKYGFSVVLAFVSGAHYVVLYLFDTYGYLFDITAFVSAITLVYIHAYTVKFISELNQKLQIKKQFGTYLSPALVEKLQKNPELLTLGGESRELSIMFTDVRGFTSISEHYGKDVQGLTKIMNRYMTAMTAKIIENDGTLDKYIGDAQMAFWNAPLDDADHAKHAVKTALQMLGNLEEFNDEVAKEGVPAFGMGLGINTDIVVVGNMGSNQRFDYTCLGDGVNLASRLEGQSKPYGVKIVLGTKTAEYVKDEYFVLELDCIAVKGKKEGVTIYTVLDPVQVDDRWHVTRISHNRMLELYRSQKFDSAIGLCNKLKGTFNNEMDHYYENWIERCEEMKSQKLPKNWDGVFRATSK